MTRFMLLVLILLSSQAEASYIYQIDKDNKYHTPPPVILDSEYHSQTTATKIGGNLLSPIGLFVGGLVGGLATGLKVGVDQGLGKTF